MTDKVKTFLKSKVCRICLCRDRKLYLMKKYNLFLYYEQVTKIDACGQNRMPQRVCWECSVRLTSAASFRAKALRSEALLYDLLQRDFFTVSDITAIDRAKNGLTSTLSQKSFDSDYADYHYTYTEPSDTKVIEEISLPTTDIDQQPVNIESSGESHSNLELSSRKVKKKKKLHGVVKVGKIDKVGQVDKRHKPANEVLNDEIFSIIDLSCKEQIDEIAKRQFSANYKNSEYKCSECFKGFQDQVAFKGHMNRHTEQCGLYQCHICKIRFKKLQALRNHSTSHMQKFTCKKCSYVTFRRHAAKLHEEYHKGTKYKCPHCLENFDKISTYMSHIRIKHPSDIVCELCGHSFVSDKGLCLHKKLKHRFDDLQVPEDGPFCTICDVQFVHKEALDRHIKLSARHGDDTETNRRVRQRESQDRVKRQNGTEQRKRTTLKLKGPISCEQCEMQLPDPLSYYRHFRKTHPDKNRTKYPSMKSKSMCEVCGKMFQSLALLQDHSWTHSGRSQFACSQCGKRFQRRYRLVAHRRLHAAVPRHACPACGKLLSTASNMHRHMLSHTGLKPFKCEMCGKCFKHASEKRVHITYVHLKKPWPKRARGKRKDKQMQLPQPIPATSDLAPPWAVYEEPKVGEMQDKHCIITLDSDYV